MRVRDMRAEDIQAIREMYARCGFAYDFPDLEGPMIEGVSVVEDDGGKVVMAAAAERLVQLYLFSGQFEHPAAKLSAIRALHTALRPKLAAKGYESAEAFLPPEVEKRFGQRLMSLFGWRRNWNSFGVKV